MFKYQLNVQDGSLDFLLGCLYMAYVTLVVLSIILFDQIIGTNIFNIKIHLSGSLIPYVCLYPISFIVLRIYGLKKVNYMIISMLLASLLFVSMATIIVHLSSNQTAVGRILYNSYQMYLIGLIGMPAGIYSSFLCLKLLCNAGVGFNVVSLSIATIIGEIVNTIIVFPIGFHGKYALSVIFSTIIVDALIFKIVMGAILAFFTVVIINIISNYR